MASARGAIVRSIVPGARRVRPGRSVTVASARLAQPAQVTARITRGNRVVRDFGRVCFPGGSRPFAVRWDGRTAQRRSVSPGTYTVEVVVRSDRAPVIRRFTVRVGAAGTGRRDPSLTG